MKRSKNFSWSGKVYFGDTDAAGVVHHARYLYWMEAARTDYLTYIGHPYEQLQSQGFGFVPLRIDAKYIAPLKHGDIFHVQVKIIKIKQASIIFLQQLFRNEQLCYEANVHLACMNEAKWKIRRLPNFLQECVD
eukprot:COSAG01_NODE_398_length_17547_cov_206.793501_3_plen_134_part_00